MSTVSSTDVKLFVALANPENTNIDTDMQVEEIVSKVESGHLSKETLQSITEESKEESSDDDDDNSGSSNEDDDSEEQSSEEEEEEEENSEDESEPENNNEDVTQSELPKSSIASWKKSSASVTSSSTKSNFSKRVQQHRGTNNNIAPNSTWDKASAYEPLRTFSSSTNPNPNFSQAAFPQTAMNEPTLSKEEKEELMLEKQSVLLELERLKGQGIVLSKTYTLQDRIDDMQFEVRRHLLNIDEQNTVQFMRDGMRLLFTGVEIANSKMGPFLDLDGWATEVGKDISKYDSSLSKLYRKYWKRSTMSPEMELAVGILGSMGMHHFKKKMGNVMGSGGGLGGMMGGLGNFTKNATKKRGSAKTVGSASFDSSDDEEGLPASFQ